MKLELSLAPSGDLRLHLPSGRFLDFTDSVGGLRTIKKILSEATAGLCDQRGYIGEFPTQHVIDAWLRQDQVEKDLAQKRREEEEREAWRERGIDLDKLEIKL
jgi:hypothetical protein